MPNLRSNMLRNGSISLFLCLIAGGCSEPVAPAAVASGDSAGFVNKVWKVASSPSVMTLVPADR